MQTEKPWTSILHAAYEVFNQKKGRRAEHDRQALEVLHQLVHQIEEEPLKRGFEGGGISGGLVFILLLVACGGGAVSASNGTPSARASTIASARSLVPRTPSTTTGSVAPREASPVAVAGATASRRAKTANVGRPTSLRGEPKRRA